MRHMLFCRDGILRVRKGVYNRAEDRRYEIDLPAEGVERLNPGFFLGLLGAGVTFEEGFTVAEFFRNLEPFAETMSRLAVMDFAAFCAEARKPQTAERDGDLDRIEIAPVITLQAEPDFEFATRDGMFQRVKGSRLYEMNLPKPKITDRHELELYWDYRAFYKTPQPLEDGSGTFDSCSVDYTPLPCWSHLPMTFAKKAILFDGTLGERAYLTSKSPLLNPRHPGVRRRRISNGRLVGLELDLNLPTPTFYDAVVKGFLWEIGFCYSPAQTETAAGVLKNRAGELDADRAARQAGESSQEALDALECAIAEDVARQDAEEAARDRREPYDEDALDLLGELDALRAAMPEGVRLPDGEPPKPERPILRLVKT